MTIRIRLTLYFVLIVAIIILLSSLAVYFVSANYREEDFYERLFQKANNTTKLLIKVDEVDASLLEKIEEDNPTSLPNERTIIYDYNNNILYNTDKENDLDVQQGLLDEIRLNSYVRFVHNGYECLGFLFIDRLDRFVVITAAEDIYGLRKVNNLKLILITVFSCSLIVTFLSGWIYSGRALKPMSRVIEKANEISISNLDLRVDEGNQKDEIAHLAQTFNKMLSRLETSFAVQKNFIANASHELRTPLTAITGQLEVVLMKERREEEYKKVIASVLDDMKNLNYISNRLLLLAQTDSDKRKMEFKSIRMDEILWQARTDLLKRNLEYVIKVTIDERIEDERVLIINGNEQLIKAAVTNLMDNACKYSYEKEVLVDIRCESEFIKVVFADKGIGIPQEDIKHIFQPFHRARNVISFKGHGIGLSLVKRIIDLHEGHINVYSILKEGTTFTIELPIQQV